MIYKLKYLNKSEAIQHLKILGVIDKDQNKAPGVKSVKHLTRIVDINAVYDGDTMITPPTLLEGYHIDILTVNVDFDFSPFEIFPTNPKHVFP